MPSAIASSPSKARRRPSATVPHRRGTFALLVTLAASLASGASLGCKSRANAECPAQIEDLNRFVRAAEEEGGGDIVLPGGAQLVMRDEPPAPPSGGAVVMLEKRYAMMDGLPLGTTDKVDALAGELTRLLKQRAELDAVIGRKAKREPLRLLVGKDEPWSSVSGAIDAATSSGAEQIALVFDAKSRLTEPPAKIVPEFFKRDFGKAEPLAPGSPQLRGLGDLAAKVFAECPAVGERISTLPSDVDGARRATEFWNRVASGLEQCGCRADMNEVKALKWAELARYGGAPRREYVVAVARCTDPGVKAVEAPADARWEEAHRAVVEAAQQKTKICLRAKK